jgi:hypothetical protein
VADGYLLENGTDKFLLEDGSGVLLIDSTPAAFVAAATAISAGSTTSVTCAMPAGLTEGMLLVAAHAIGSSSDTVTFPSGWTKNRYTGATGVGDTFAWKIAGASEPSLVVTSGSNRNHGLIVAAYTGIDVVSPIVSWAVTGQTSATTLHVAPGVAASGTIFEVVMAMDHPPGSGGDNTNWTWEAGLTERGQAFPTANGFQGTSVGLSDANGITSTGDTPPRDATSTLSAVGSAWSIALRSAGGPPVPVTPTVAPRVNGPNQTVNTRTFDATSVRLKIAEDSGFTTGVVFTSGLTPNSNGWTTHDYSGLGLTAGTRYYYRVAMTDTGDVEVLDSLAVGRFTPPVVGSAHDFVVYIASCCNAADSASMAAINTRDDGAMYLHPGDFWYADGTGVNTGNYRTQMLGKLNAPNHHAVFSRMALAYTSSDHDFGMVNNGYGESGTGARDIFNSVYREMIPATLVQATTGTYYAFTLGRVRFIIMDTRSFMVNPANTDNSSKTKLGATQKQWVKDEITNATEALIVLVGDVPWTGATAAGDDAWDGYTTERTELASHFTSVGKPIIYCAGDMHAVAADDGTHAAGGIFVVQAAPLKNNASIKGDPYTAGPYPASGSTVVEQFGRLAFTDTGTQITVVYNGYSSDNTLRVTQTMTIGGVSGTLAATLADDTLAAAGTVANPVTGTIAATLADDTLAASGTETITGTLASTLADDTLAASGTAEAGITGTMAVTLADDTLAASGAETISGTLAAILADDVLAASGTVANPVTGTLAVTLAGDTLSAAGTETISGALTASMADDVLAGSGAETITGTLAATLADDLLAGTGTVAVPVTGILAVTLANDTLAASGTAGPADVTGTLAVTLANDTLAGSGAQTLSGSLAAILAGDTLAGVGTVANPISGTLAAMLGDDLLSAAGAETISGTLVVTLVSDMLNSATGGPPVNISFEARLRPRRWAAGAPAARAWSADHQE